MSEEYIVNQGDCLESIAFEYGFLPDTLWSFAGNANLKQQRHSLNILLPGDKVVIPDKRKKLESGATEQKHSFMRKGVPSKIHIVVKRNGQPRANEPYVLVIDGDRTSDTTNAQGEIEQPIPPNAESGTLTIGEGDDAVEYELHLGHLDPADEVTGAQGRLLNLGFYTGSLDGQMSDETIRAITAYQESAGLPRTGDLDQATQNALEQEHQS